MKKLILFFAAISFSWALGAQSGRIGNLRWELKNNTLTIRGYGNMPNYLNTKESGTKNRTIATTPWYNDQIDTIVIRDGITTIGTGAFAYYRNLKSVSIPNNVTTIGEWAFAFCNNLASITIPPNVKSIGNCAFMNCESFSTVTIPSSVTSIGTQAFSDCTNLSSVTIPNSVTNIGYYAFSHCMNLSSVTIPNSVVNIGYYAFELCENLKDIYVNWKIPFRISNYVFKNVPATATLHVPAGTKSLYQRTTGWNIFNIVEEASSEDKISYVPSPSPRNNLAEIDWSLPSYSSTNMKEVNIKACIKSLTKIEQVNVFLNGQLCRGLNAVVNDGCDYAVNQNINLAKGSNTLKIQVENSGGIKEAKRIVNYIAPDPVSVNKRYALIVGNAAYRNGSLINPVNDAVDIEAKLKQLDFTTSLVTNATKEKLEYAIRDIVQKAKGYDAVMFFYSGHAVQYEGKNYLIPINVSLQTPSDISYCIDMDFVLGKMEDAQCEMKIVVLDACRNNPFPSWTKGVDKNGLTGLDAPSGTFISYAAGKGKVAQDGTGRNSPYTEEFLKVLDIPGLNILDFFQEVGDRVKIKTNKLQTPWTESSFSGKFYFNNK